MKYSVKKASSIMSKIISFLKHPLPYVLLFSMAVKIYYGAMWDEYIYHATGDSPDYVIRSFSELSWIHRMPVYQLFILLMRGLLGEGAGDGAVFTAAVKVQIFSGIVSCGIFYLIIRKLSKRDWLAAMGTVIYAMQPHLAYYEKAILTEALAVHMMVIWVYMLVCYLETGKNTLALGIGVFSLVMTMMRPSFVILYPVLALFWVIRLLFDREKDKTLLWGIGGLAISTVFLLLYCIHNQALTGRFMLSCVSYDNQLSILIESELYENEEFPDITDAIRRDMQGKDNSLKIARNIFEEYGYDNGVVYLRKTIKKNLEEYIKCLYMKWRDHSDEYIGDRSWEKYTSGQRADMAGKTQTLLLPVSFKAVLIVSLAEIAAGIIIWCRAKKVPYTLLGFPVLVVAITILSFGTLTHASPQRICVHMTPLVLLMAAGIVGQILDRFRKQKI